ncbi:hypothetical protein DRW03_24740 [Corallococcus sp. H22C18031201]|nr:hypothetical protein DRW03_24740 [Corallococcus sp. H22C18031201]
MAPIVQDVTDGARQAAEATGRAVERVLDDPRLRERLPGGSLPLLGAGLVATAVVMPWVFGLAYAVPAPWAFVMLVGSAMLVARELRASGRTLPEAIVRTVDVAEHRAFLPLFTALTLTHAFVQLGASLASLLWLLAAVVLGFVQWRAFRVSPASTEEAAGSLEEVRLQRWGLAGVAVCVVALLLPWGTGVGVPIPGLQLHKERTIYVGQDFSHDVEDKATWKWESGAGGTWQIAIPGRTRPGGQWVVLSLLALAMLVSLRRARAAVPPVVPLLVAGFVTVWGLLGMASLVGPWLFLAGAVLLDVAVWRDRR